MNAEVAYKEILRRATKELVADLSTVSSVEKLRTVWTQNVLANIRFIIFRLPVCFSVLWILKYAELWPCLLFCMDVKLGIAEWEKNTGWEWLGLRCWGKFWPLGGLGDRGRGRELEEVTRSIMICTPHKILFGRSNQEEWDGLCLGHVCREIRDVWWGNL